MTFTYDYKDRKIKLEEILDNMDKINEVEILPRDENFTYKNGYKSWVSSIFIDIRNSTELIEKNSELNVAKVIRGFTSEIIEILRRDTDKLKEIGIRGDCVYAIYSSPKQKDIYDLADRAYYINTYLKMLNSLLSKRHLPEITAGIGLATSQTLVVKAGRHSSGINNLVWIGESVSMACNLANIANKEIDNPILLSSMFYHNYSKYIEEHDQERKETLGFYKLDKHERYGTFYHANIVKTDFNKWIADDMPI
ncbi:adenylate/guanylate cyclase domain-containing protein [Enterococcus mundtii]|uniref:adenylate/guanylate cyclase domain-containing protein n=1 Tax=Enterococcus mundtii TaxID=53346 RepID=UPI00044F7215|nr:adenylate/guanylate cyclase domain-containing protein [Enterococcus mundtii]EYT94477.1 adenylate cyclase [Enterococcus mundtii CRL35]